QMTNHVSDHAKQAGLEFNFDNMKATNTRSAHRLIHYANKHHKANEIVEKLFAAHFINGEDIGNITFLTKLAGKIGLNENEVKTILEDKLAFDKDVQTDINE